MIEFLLEVLGELLLQFVAEVLLELGLHALVEPFQKRPNPWLAAMGYLCFGVAAGGLSLLLVPSHLVTTKALRILNVIITPLAVGALMAAIGVWRTRRGQQLFRIDRFAYGYLFAVALALVRYRFAG
jgi:hypothetical protein